MTSRATAFLSVGAIGFVLQMSAMALLTAAGWPYASAAVVAVEAAVLNNFFWHERWTWRDRALTSGALSRLARFHFSTGLTSIVGSLVFTALLVEWAGAPVLLANAAAVVLTAVANFLVADRWVFARPAAALVSAMLVAGAPAAHAAELQPETLSAWQAYVRAPKRGETCESPWASRWARRSASPAARFIVGGGPPWFEA